MLTLTLQYKIHEVFCRAVGLYAPHVSEKKWQESSCAWGREGVD